MAAVFVDPPAGIQNVPGAHGAGGLGSRNTVPPFLSTRFTARKLWFHVGVNNQPAEPVPVILPAGCGEAVSFSSFGVARLRSSPTVSGNVSTPMSSASVNDAMSYGGSGDPSLRRVHSLSGYIKG